MQVRKKASRLFAAAMAFVLVFALAFMTFDANVMRSAFASEGDGQAVETMLPQEPAAPADEPDAVELVDPEETEEIEDQPNPDGEAVPESEDTQDVSGQVEGVIEESQSGEITSDEDNAPARAGPEDSTEQEIVTTEADRESERTVEFASATVTFYANTAEHNPAILARKAVSAPVGQTAEVVVSDVVAPAPTAAEVFEGWSFAGAVHTDSISVDPQAGNVRLYPAFSSGHWLRFDSASDEATSVASQFVAATATADELGTLPVPSRVGYTFEGWYEGSREGKSIEYGEQVTDGAGTVTDPARLRDLVKSSDVELFAKWAGAPTTYRVITWLQNPDDDDYTYHGFETVGDDPGERAISGETTDVTQLPEFAGFQAKSVDQGLIAGDGSTVVHARYDRMYYDLKFHDARDVNAAVIDDLTINARYGADIRDQWPNPATNGGKWPTTWYTTPDSTINVFITGLEKMPLYGADFYLKDDVGTNYNTVYRVQTVDGANTFIDYASEPFSSKNDPSTTADDYKSFEGFMVNAASAADAEEIRANHVGDKLATYDANFEKSVPIGTSYKEAPEITAEGDVARHTLYFYYLRCAYDIVFEENGGPDVADVTGVLYESPLLGCAPDSYVVGETKRVDANGMSYTFAGWYDNELLADEPFDFENKVMPAGNVVLYAKWTPTLYLVQADPNGGEFVNDEQSTYFWVEHGDSVAYLDAVRHYVADDNGQFIYDYESASSDTDSDKFGTAQYVTAQSSDAGQRYRWSQDAYSLYGWFVNAGDAASSTVPFDFGSDIIADTSIIAKWRAAGVFDIAYNPVMRTASTTVSGDIETMRDEGYADLSPTIVLNTPANVESSDGNVYEFVGWQVVESFEEGAGALVDRLYAEGDGFVVDSELASDNTIYLQAIYEQTPDDPVTPSPEEPGDSDDPAGSDDSENSGDGDDIVVVEPEESTTLDGAAESSETSSASATANAISEVLPKTGDAHAVPIAISGVALVALGLALIARARRDRQKEETAIEE